MNGNEFLEYAIANLKANPDYEDVDMSSTSAFYNMTILPFALMGKPINDMVSNLFETFKLENLSEAQLDDVASITFAERRKNTVSAIGITLTFKNVFEPTEPIMIYTSDEFRTNNGEIFYPIQNYIHRYETLPITGDGQYRTLSINATSTDAKKQVAAGNVSSSSFLHPLLISVSNTQASSKPLDKETNAEFITRIQRSLGERSLSKGGNIASFLYRNFPSYSDVSVIQSGDREMQRDIAVAARAWSGHMGGMADVYLKGPLMPATYTAKATRVPGGYQFSMRRYKGFAWEKDESLTPWLKMEEMDANGAPVIIPAMPVISIDWASSSITNTTFFKRDDGTYDYRIDVMPDPEEKSFGKNYRYSIYEHIRIFVKTTSEVGDTETVTLNYNTLLDLEAAQNAIIPEADVCSNILLKSYIPIFIDRLSVTCKRSTPTVESALADELIETITNWNVDSPINFTTLFKNFDFPVITSEVWKNEIYSLPYDIDDKGNVIGYKPGLLVPPCYAVMRIENIDGSTKKYLSTQQLAPVLSGGLSASYKTCRFFIKKEDIIFVTAQES